MGIFSPSQMGCQFLGKCTVILMALTWTISETNTVTTVCRWDLTTWFSSVLLTSSLLQRKQSRDMLGSPPSCLSLCLMDPSWACILQSLPEQCSFVVVNLACKYIKRWMFLMKEAHVFQAPGRAPPWNSDHSDSCRGCTISCLAQARVDIG